MKIDVEQGQEQGVSLTNSNENDDVPTSTTTTITTAAVPNTNVITTSTQPHTTVEHLTLKEKLQHARDTQTGIQKYKTIAAILIKFFGNPILRVITVCVCIAMIVIGAINLNNCPISQMIPIYLLVGGIIGIIPKILFVVMYFIERRRGSATIQTESEISTRISKRHIFNLIVLIWFLIGSFFVYSAKYPPAFNEEYCDKTTYYFAFILISTVYGIFIVGLALLCCIFYARH